MATTITVSQATNTKVVKTVHAAFMVQRTFRNGMTAPEIAAAKALVAPFFKNLTFQWSGGYANTAGNPTASQAWANADFGGTGIGSRVWTTFSNRKGVDAYFTELADVNALVPGHKMNIVMHDIPAVMNNGFTRGPGYVDTPWPPPANWGDLSGNGAYALWVEFRNRVGAANLDTLYYGQEMKGVGSRTNATNMNNFTDGYLTFAALFRADAGNAGIKLGFLHYNFNATGNVNTTRKTVVDATIANKNWASLSTDDKTSIDLVMDRVIASGDPTLYPDVWTLDHSVVDNSSTDTWRGDYDNVLIRCSLDEGIQAAFREHLITKFGSGYGSAVQLDTVEQYYDVRTGDSEVWSTPEQFVLRLAIMMSNYRGGESTQLHWWEPQSGTLAFEGTDMVNGPFMSNDGDDDSGIAAAVSALKAAFPPGTQLVLATTNNNHVLVLSSVSTAFVLNGLATTESVSILTNHGTVNDSVGGMFYKVISLPTTGGGGANISLTDAGENQGETNALTGNITLTVAAAVGDDVLVFADIDGITEPSEVDTVTDSRGNTYVIDHVPFTNNGNNNTFSWFRAKVTTALLIGDTITVNWGNGVTQKGRWAINAVVATGFLASPVDKVIAAVGGAGTLATGTTTGTLAQADEVVVAGMNYNLVNGANSATAGTGFTKVANFGSGVAASGRDGAVEYKLVAATTAVVPTFTPGASVNWGIATVTYKVASPPSPPVNTVAPVASASPNTNTGSTMSTTNGSWTGLATITFTYQWQRDGVDIVGAVNSTYTIQDIDAGTTLRSVVTGANADGTTPANSNGVAIPAAPTNSAVPTISGTTGTGDVLTRAAGTWTGSPSFTQVWQRDDVTIGGQTATTYTVQAADAGHAITVEVTGTNGNGSAVAESAATNIPAAPTNTAPPTFTGTATVGSLQTSANGTWTGSPAFTYQWRRDGVNIGGATASTYTTVAADGATTLSVAVTGTNANGAATAVSAGTPIAPPVTPGRSAAQYILLELL